MAIEIERKFLVTDNSYRDMAYHCNKMVQGYLCRENGNSVRIRISDDKAYLTVKGPSHDGGISRYEWEKEITLEEATELLQLCGPKIEKCRYLVKCGNHTYEVDEFYGDNEGLVVAEIELGSDNEEFLKPSFIGEEVTGQVRYYNSHLTRFPYKEW
ncbi:MAG: CYTH domain-containing protein [Bacteroidaceae bacterium]|nr:CYTH domain-containing protein [Bacteroidaceae bacterium]